MATANSRTITVVIAGDPSGAQKAFKNTNQSASNFQSKMAKVGGVVAGAFAVDALVGFSNEMLSLDAQLSAIDTKAKTVFEGQAGTMRKWADDNNESFGLTDDALLGLAGNFGDLLKPMGFTSDQAATMSKDVVGLAGALSAWSGGTIDAAGAAETLADAMLGETDGLKALGISIGAADIDARLAAKGQQELEGSARQMAEAVAVQELIFEKSTDAQKAWAEGGNESLSALNAQKAATAELREQLAEKLAPAIAKVTEIGSRALMWLLNMSPGTQKLIGVGLALVGALFAIVKVTQAWTAVQAALNVVMTANPIGLIVIAIVGLIAAIVLAWQHSETFRDIVTGAFDAVKNVVVGVFNWVQDNWPLLLAILTGPIGLAVLAIVKNWDTIKDAVTGVKNWIVDRWNDVVGFITGLPGKIANAAKGMFDGIKNAFKGAINWIIRAWNGLQIEIPGFDPPGPGPKFPGFTVPWPKIPELAHGGVISSPTLAMIGENPRTTPEIVSPVDLMRKTFREESGGGGKTYIINVTVPVAADKGRVGREVIEAIHAAERQDGKKVLVQ